MINVFDQLNSSVSEIAEKGCPIWSNLRLRLKLYHTVVKIDLVSFDSLKELEKGKKSSFWQPSTQLEAHSILCVSIYIHIQSFSPGCFTPK